MKGQKTLMSSADQDGIEFYETPPKLFRLLNDAFHFTLDAATKPGNSLCSKSFYLPIRDALTLDWHNPEPEETHWSIYCNPVYGRGLIKWIAKGIEATRKGSTVVFLLPARTDTRAFHALKAEDGFYCRFIFLKGRLKFRINGKMVRDRKGTPMGAPFPSVIAILSPKPDLSRWQ